MAYRAALEAAGAEVHEFQEFGSYQGDWIAKVTFKGETGFVRGSYGSCSGCDAFESEFGYEDPTPEQLASFGLPYLEGLYADTTALLRELDMGAKWDSDCEVAASWVRAHL